MIKQNDAQEQPITRNPGQREFTLDEALQAVQKRAEFQLLELARKPQAAVAQAAIAQPVQIQKPQTQPQAEDQQQETELLALTEVLGLESLLEQLESQVLELQAEERLQMAEDDSEGTD